MSHPSFFALDAHALDPRAGEVQTHLAPCPQCQAHLAALRASTPFPAKLEGLERPWARPWWRLVTLGLAAAALALSVAFLATRERPQLITAKGTPVTALWLNRDGKVTAWKGQPVHAGDVVRIEVAPAGFTHVTVYDENTRQVLYEARIPESAPTLTPAWELDGAAPSESLRVVLSLSPLAAEVLQAPACVAGAESHCTRFTLTRE